MYREFGWNKVGIGCADGEEKEGKKVVKFGEFLWVDRWKRSGQTMSVRGMWNYFLAEKNISGIKESRCGFLLL